MLTPPNRPDTLGSIVAAAAERAGVASAAIFIVDEGSGQLTLAAAAGVEGHSLERLVIAVRDPAHPIARTAVDGKSSFDVTPVAPGGPALRSHLPLVVENDGSHRTVGVLAVAHELPFNDSERDALMDLADQAARLTGGESR